MISLRWNLFTLLFEKYRWRGSSALGSFQPPVGYPLLADRFPNSFPDDQPGRNDITPGDGSEGRGQGGDREATGRGWAGVRWTLSSIPVVAGRTKASPH